MKDKMKCKLKNMDVWVLAGYIYLYLPVIIFYITWIKPLISIPSVIGMLYLIGLGGGISRKISNSKRKLAQTIAAMLAVFSMILMTSFLCGIGGYVAQAGDWKKHNFILHELMEKSWPVRITGPYGSGILTYYIGFYIIPSIFGKLFGFHASEVVFLVMSVLGLFLICILNVEKAENYGRKLIVFSIVLIVFATFITPLSEIYRIWNPGDAGDGVHYFSESLHIQFTSNIMNIRWLAPQYIPAAMAVSLIRKKRYDYREWGAIAVPVIVYSAFCFLGIVVLCILSYTIDSVRNLKSCKISSVISVPNIISVLIISPFAVYLYGIIKNPMSEAIGMKLCFISFSDNWIALYVIELSWIIWAVILYKYEKTSSLYLSSCLMLLVLPFIYYGNFGDLCMGMSRPAVFILCAGAAGLMNQYITDRLYRYALLLGLCLLIAFGGHTKELKVSVETNGIARGNGDYTCLEEESFFQTMGLLSYQYVNWNGTENVVLKR